jgi:hypothetical protein
LEREFGYLSVLYNLKPDMKRLLLIFFLFLISSSMFAQNARSKGDLSIRINGSGSDYRSKFQVDVYRTEKSIKIVYAVFDSINGSKFRADKNYQIVLQNTMKNYELADSVAKNNASQELRNLLAKYSVYDRDSVTLNPGETQSYYNLLTRIAEVSRDTLEQKELNKNRFILDGVGIGYTIISELGTKSIGVRSPRPSTHPLLYNLLKSTLDIGRENKLAPFVHRKSFLGY